MIVVEMVVKQIGKISSLVWLLTMVCKDIPGLEGCGFISRFTFVNQGNFPANRFRRGAKIAVRIFNRL